MIYLFAVNYRYDLVESTRFDKIKLYKTDDERTAKQRDTYCSVLIDSISFNDGWKQTVIDGLVAEQTRLGSIGFSSVIDFPKWNEEFSADLIAVGIKPIIAQVEKTKKSAKSWL